MSGHVHAVLEQAKRLTADERIELARELLASVDEDEEAGTPEETEGAWGAGGRRRAAARGGGGRGGSGGRGARRSRGGGRGGARGGGGARTPPGACSPRPSASSARS